MSLVVAVAPGIDRFPLLDRLLRELHSRGHRTEALCFDAAEREFWRTQGHACSLTQPQRFDPADARLARIPFAEFAEFELSRVGQRKTRRALRSAESRLRRIAAAIYDRFDRDRPDLLLLHKRRTGAHLLAQFAAREAGIRVQWSGDGLLPGTIQIDSIGIDGDSPIARRSAWDYRNANVDEALLRAALASAAGKSQPLPLPLRAPRPVALRARVAAAWRGRGEGTGIGFFEGLAIGSSIQDRSQHPAQSIDLPKEPFLAVLLQRRDDPRVRIDAKDAPTPLQLTLEAMRAAATLDRRATVVAILPPEGLAEADLRPLRHLDGVQLELAHATSAACMAATAVVTINSPHAGVALLADTPVLHFGRALYGTPGVAFSTELGQLAATLRMAMRDDQPELRRRFLSTVLQRSHLWCSADDPDHNGINGWILRIEDELAQKMTYGADLRYRAGPAWPLQEERR